VSEYDGLTPREELELRRRREEEGRKATNEQFSAVIRAQVRRQKRIRDGLPPTQSAIDKRREQKAAHTARARELEAQGLSRAQIAAKMSVERGVATDARTVRRWLNTEQS